MAKRDVLATYKQMLSKYIVHPYKQTAYSPLRKSVPRSEIKKQKE